MALAFCAAGNVICPADAPLIASGPEIVLVPVPETVRLPECTKLVAVHVVVFPAPPTLIAAVAPPAKLTVVAVVLTSAKVVEGVVIPVVTAMPTANGILAVVVCWPSFVMHNESAVAMSFSVLLPHEISIVVPLTTGFPGV